MPRYTAEQFIKAIPGTGGAITPIAERVGCNWHTAKDWIEKHATVKKAFEAERHRVTDKARYNVVKAIVKDEDLQMSKWWLQVMDNEFKPKQQIEHTGDLPVIREVLVRMPDADADNLDDE